MEVVQWCISGRSARGGRRVKTQPGLGRTGNDAVRVSLLS